MEIEVSKIFAKQFKKLDPQQQKAVSEAFDKLAENPKSVNFESKTGSAKGVFSMRLDGNNRVGFVHNADKNLVPSFVGNHRDYDRYLKSPDLNPPTKVIKMDVPDKLVGKGLLGKTSFSIGHVKLRGVVGGIITAGTVLALGGTPKEAMAATTPGHVGVELAEGDIKGAKRHWLWMAPVMSGVLPLVR